MKKPCFPDYDHSIMSLSNSILENFGCETYHGTLPSADDALRRMPENVVIILLDGLGMVTLEQLPGNSFLRSHLRETYSSVFPPTTTAATTSLLSGLSPCQHGWLGWDMYFPEFDRNISLFPNTFSGTQTLASKHSATWRRFPYRPIPALIQEAGFHAYYSTGHEQPYPMGLGNALDRAVRLCRLPQRKFIYVYYEQPDGVQHCKGVESHECHEELMRIDRQVEAFSKSVEDTLILITADHGHIDIQGQDLTLQKGILECLSRPPSMEARACSFFVKPEKRKAFETLFTEAYGNEFLLYPMEQVFAEELFGPGDRHPALTDTLGDYLAISVGHFALFNDEGGCRAFAGHHSGLTSYEMEIPLIIVDCY